MTQCDRMNTATRRFIRIAIDSPIGTPVAEGHFIETWEVKADAVDPCWECRKAVVSLCIGYC